MVKSKIIATILLIFVLNFAYSGDRKAYHYLGFDVSLGYPIGIGLIYGCTYKKVDFHIAKIQVLNFYNEDFFMQYMAGIGVSLSWHVYLGVRAGYWHSRFSFPHGGFCLEPELIFYLRNLKGYGKNRIGYFTMAITYNYLAYNVRAYPNLKLAFHFDINRRND